MSPEPIAYAATIELSVSDGLSPFDATSLTGLAIVIPGLAAMWAGQSVAQGPARFGIILILWLATSWLALRFGLAREDRMALGGLARRLRLTELKRG